MTRRERMEARAERRREWATKAEGRADTRFANARRIADMIPLGQPILVGHHSERHARRDAQRIHDNMAAGVAESKLAKHHAQAASTLEDRLETSVFSDDADAIPALEARIAEREQEAERAAAINKAWRKGGGNALLAMGLAPSTVETFATTMRQCPWLKGPLSTTNLRASIRRDRERIEEIQRRRERAERAASAGGVLIEPRGQYTVVTFAEKPEREVLDALRAAGFSWTGSSWCGESTKLPAIVTELAQESR